jgi:hypothetical protein
MQCEVKQSDRKISRQREREREKGYREIDAMMSPTGVKYKSSMTNEVRKY